MSHPVPPARWCPPHHTAHLRLKPSFKKGHLAAASLSLPLPPTPCHSPGEAQCPKPCLSQCAGLSTSLSQFLMAQLCEKRHQRERQQVRIERALDWESGTEFKFRCCHSQSLNSLVCSQDKGLSFPAVLMRVWWESNRCYPWKALCEARLLYKNAKRRKWSSFKLVSLF